MKPSEVFNMSGQTVQATSETIKEAAEIIKSGGLVAFPTETVYGLGANALDPTAVAKIFDAKGRPQDNPLILHVSGMEQAALYAEINDRAEALMKRFWPGPLTIVLYSLGDVPAVTRGGLDTVALRMPSDPVALELIKMSGLPIAAPSANRSGRPSPTSAQVVASDLGDSVDMILDSGSAVIGLESTVVDATGDTVAVLRPGWVTREMLSEVITLADAAADSPLSRRSPGTRHRHYAPLIPLILWNGTTGELLELSDSSWCYMGMREPPLKPVRKIIFRSIEEYARRLFSSLRELERCGADVIVAELPEGDGLGEAVKNRLIRAAGA